MHYTIRFGVLAMVFFLVSAYSAWALESSGLTIINTNVTPGSVSPGESVNISCGVSHPLGSAFIIRVAATLFHGTKVTTLPRLYDDGTHGDTTSGDGIFALNVNAPVAFGRCKITVSAVDKDRNEIESDPVFFTIE